MSERFAVRFGEDMAKRLEFRTINGICARIIQYYGRRIGKTPFELVKDEKTTTGMLIRICQDHGMGYPTESDLKNVRTLITYIKKYDADRRRTSEVRRRVGYPNCRNLTVNTVVRCVRRI